MYIRELTYRSLGQSPGAFEGTYTGTIRGDKDSAATIKIILTDRGNRVTGQITLGKGLKIALGGFCWLEDIDLSSITISGQTSPDNPRYLQTSVKVTESPVNTPTVKSADIDVTITANLSADGNTIEAQVTFDPLEGVITFVGKVDLKKKGCKAKTLPVTLNKQSSTGSLNGYIYDYPLTAAHFLRNERPVILNPSRRYDYSSGPGLGVLYGSKASKRPDVASAATLSPAEVVRLTEEIIQLAQRNAWPGVDDTYKKLENMGDQAFDLIPKGRTSAFNIHRLGANASRQLGDMQNWRKRLLLACRSLEFERGRGVLMVGGESINDLQKPIILDLSYIDENFGSVSIPPRSKSTSKRQRAQLTLIAVVLSSDPDLRSLDQLNSIKFAEQVIKETGAFSGLLPAGYYKLADQPFTVEKGPAERTGIKPKDFLWGI